MAWLFQVICGLGATALKALKDGAGDSGGVNNPSIARKIVSGVPWSIKMVAGFIASPFIAVLAIRHASSLLRRLIAAGGLFFGVMGMVGVFYLLNTWSVAIMVGWELGWGWGLALLFSKWLGLVLASFLSLCFLMLVCRFALRMNSDEVIAHLRSIKAEGLGELSSLPDASTPSDKP